MVHNYGLSATDRAQAVDYLQKHPFRGPSTVRQILEDPQFLEKVKNSGNQQEILNAVRTHRASTSVTQSEVDNADINQLIDNNNREHEARTIETDAPMDTSVPKDKKSFMDKVKVWWHGGIGWGESAKRRRKAVRTLWKESPKLAKALDKNGLIGRILDMLAAKVDDPKGTREFLDRLAQKVETSEDWVTEWQDHADKIGDPVDKKAIAKLTREEIKTIFVDEDHIQRVLEEHPDVNEKTLRDLIVVSKRRPQIANPDELFKNAYKQTWEACKSTFKSEHRHLLDNLTFNNAKGFLLKALDNLKTKDKIDNFLASLEDSHKKTTNGEIKQIMKDMGIKDGSPSKISQFRSAFNADDTGLFSKTDQQTLDSSYMDMIKTNLGLEDNNAARFLEGLKDAKSLTPDKITKLGKKVEFKLNLNPMAYDFTGESWVPIDRIASWRERTVDSWRSTWEGSSAADMKAGLHAARNQNKLISSFTTFSTLVGGAGMALSYYTCAAQQLGQLHQKEQDYTEHIEEGKKQLEELGRTLTTLEADIKISKQVEIEAHCALSNKFVAFILEMTGNMDQPVRPCSSLTANATDLVGRRLTYTAIANCYGEKFKDGNPYKGKECPGDSTKIPNLDTDYQPFQKFLRDKLGNTRTFLQKNKDIIAEELDRLVLRYNVEVLVNQDSSLDEIGSALKSFGFTEGDGEGADFTNFSILKLIAQFRVDEALYHGYPLKCIREEKIGNQSALQRWEDTFMALDEDKLTEFRDAVVDHETLDYMKKKAKRGRYHFSGAGLSAEELEEKILTEIATRVLISESEYEDEDGERYPLQALRTQEIC